jgi:hypothetical protein
MLRSHQIALLEENKDPAAGGGAGGAPAGGGAATFTEAQQGEIAKIVNSAVSSHLKRGLAPAIGEALKSVNWAETLKLDETLDAKLAKLKPEGGADPSGGNQPPKVDPQVAALTAKVQELTANIQKQQDEVKAANERARNEKAFADLKSALGGQVRPETLELAARDLFLAQKRIAFDEQGNPLFTVKKAPYAGATEEDVPMPLTDGVAHWLKSEEAKVFLPAPNANQQPRVGAPGPRAPQQRQVGALPQYEQPATTDAEKIRRAEEQAQALAAKYPHLANT